jgi:hypothetical protein
MTPGASLYPVLEEVTHRPGAREHLPAPQML